VGLRARLRTKLHRWMNSEWGSPGGSVLSMSYRPGDQIEEMYPEDAERGREPESPEERERDDE